MTIAGTCFNWGLSGREMDSDIKDMLMQKHLLCYSGRTGELPTGSSAQIGYLLGGFQDQINFEDENAFGLLNNYACRSLYLLTETLDLSGTPLELVIRVKYDIVTLSTSEMSELYQKLGVCG